MVNLQLDEHGGPFWDEDGPVSDDFDDVHRWLGISRELYDDAMAWNDEFAALWGGLPEERKRQAMARQHKLVRQLRQQVTADIEVVAPSD